MAKFSLAKLMNDKSFEEIEKSNDFKIEMIPLEKIKPSTMNNYIVQDVEELKTSIEMSGLQQNLLVRCDGENYEILSGHRRYKAVCGLKKEGSNQFDYLPCKVVEKTDDLRAELELIFANSTSRVLTDFEKTFQASRIKEILLQMKKNGYKLGGRVREIMADILDVSPTQIGRMESIDEKLTTDFKEEFKAGNINITMAYEVSRLEEKEQAELYEDFKENDGLSIKNVEEKKKEVGGVLEELDDKTDITVKHVLKIVQPYFNDVRRGAKTFEVRYNDRNYKVGDILELREWSKTEKKYSGKSCVVRVSYIFRGGQYGVVSGWVVLGIERIDYNGKTI